MCSALRSRNPLSLRLEIVEESDFSDTAYNSALCIQRIRTYLFMNNAL